MLVEAKPTITGKQQDYLLTWKSYLIKKEGFKCSSGLIRPTSLMGLAGAPAEAVKPYEAKVEWLTWFQVSRGGTKWRADKLNNVFQWFWLKERQSGLLFIFQNSCKFADAHGVSPRSKNRSSPVLMTRTSPLLFRKKTTSFNRKVLGKPFEFKTYLLELQQVWYVTDKSYVGVNITPDKWWRCDRV